MAEVYDKPSDYGEGQKGEWRRWTMELKLADKREDEWRKAAKKVYDRYRGKNRRANSFNILWSNTETLAPALFNSPPVPNVQRRYKDPDPVGKVVSQMLERALEFQCDTDKFMDSIKADVLDILVLGRGVSRVRYVPQLAGEASENDDDPLEGSEELVWEQCELEHVQWDDFRMGPGKTWPEVMWIGFRHQLSREELCEKFGDEIGNAIVLDDADDEDVKKQEDLQGTFRTAEVWEIWDKEAKIVRFLSKGHKDEFLKLVKDPLELTEFYPIPRPLLAINDTSSLEPLILFEQYQEQAKELDRISSRINKIVDSLKLRGMYDATLSELKNLMSAEDNQLVPIQNAQQWLDKGLDKGIWMMDIQPAANVLKVLYEQREATKQVIYELTGISDIRRGATDAGETLGAQQLKAEFGAQRINSLTREVSRYARDHIRLMAEVISAKFQPDTLMKMTNMPLPTQAQVKIQMMQYQMQAQQAGQQPPPQPITIEQVMQLLRDDCMMNFRIDVETDSIVAATQQQDMAGLKEVLVGVTQFVEGVAPAVQSGAFPVDAVKEIVMTIARRAKMGPSVEDALDKMKAPNPPPDQMAHEQQLEQMKGQQTAQLEQMKAQTQAQQHALELQQDAQAAEAQGQRDMQLEQWKQEMQARQVQHQNELEAQRAAAESQLNAQLEQQKQRHESYIKQQELDFERWKTELVEANKMAIAQISAKSAVDNTLLKAEQTANTEVSEELDDEPSAIDKLASMHGEAMQRMEQLMMHMTKPRTIQRGPDGKVIGVQ